MQKCGAKHYIDSMIPLISPTVFDPNLQPQPSHPVDESSLSVDISTLLTACELPCIFDISNIDDDDTFESLLNNLDKGQSTYSNSL